MRAVLTLLALAGLAAGGVFYYRTYVASDPPDSFRTAAVRRGDLISTISATGTVEAEEFVDVGAQVAGRIVDFGVDPSELKGRKPADVPPKERAKLKRIDYRANVPEGTELAYIDPTLFNAQLAQAEAALQRAKADLIQLQAKRKQAAAEWERARRLRPDRAAQERPAASGGSPASEAETPLEYRAMSDSDYDLAKANYEMADAYVLVGEKTIQQAAATRDMAQTNLNYTTIVSPVEGVIIDRRVNVGQTVVASLNAPSLFLIAKDLKKMQVWAAVNEADIGKIGEKMPVRFTVDTFPGEVFRGQVAQIRLNATMTQNVVTYPVVISFDNADGKVFPYMTANVQFELDQRRDVLLVPNAALRWKPRPEQIVPELRETARASSSGKGGDKQGAAPAKPGEERKSAAPAGGPQDRGRLWVQEGQFVRPVDVQVGASDGSLTEVSGDGIQEGLDVVIGEVRAAQAADAGKNPFGPPQIPRGARPKGV